MKFLEAANGIVWGIPALLLILGVGLYLSIETGFAQLRFLPRAIKTFCDSFRNKGDGSNSAFRALCTALAATVGTGNIVGVAGAIALGGPGSIFWMWICALLGMITKYAEAVLAVTFRSKEKDGSYCGGPMIIMEKGLGKKWRPMAWLYCFFGVAAAFGMGNATQVNAVVTSVNSAIGYLGGRETVTGNLIIGGFLAVFIAAIFWGGFKCIGTLAELLVPAASAAYLALCIGALMYHRQRIPQAFADIIIGAFSPEAVTGGVIGSCFLTLRTGAARGVFTNEAGMGTASIAHATSAVSIPGEQGLMGIMEVFLDTIVICTMTALVILTSGIEMPYGTDVGALLTGEAFAATYGSWVSILLALFLCSFAFATMLGWGYYGLQCARYLFGEKSDKPFIVLQAVVAAFSTLCGTELVWQAAETVNGLMAIPNLLTLGMLSSTVVRHTRVFSQEARLIQASNKNRPKGNRWRHVRSHERGSQVSSHR